MFQLLSKLLMHLQIGLHMIQFDYLIDKLAMEDVLKSAWGGAL